MNDNSAITGKHSKSAIANRIVRLQSQSKRNHNRLLRYSELLQTLLRIK